MCLNGSWRPRGQSYCLARGNRSQRIGSFRWLAQGLRCKFAINSVSLRSPVCDSGRLFLSQQQHRNLFLLNRRSPGFWHFRNSPECMPRLQSIWLHPARLSPRIRRSGQSDQSSEPRNQTRVGLTRGSWRSDAKDPSLFLQLLGCRPQSAPRSLKAKHWFSQRPERESINGHKPLHLPAASVGGPGFSETERMRFTFASSRSHASLIARALFAFSAIIGEGAPSAPVMP